MEDTDDEVQAQHRWYILHAETRPIPEDRDATVVGTMSEVEAQESAQHRFQVLREARHAVRLSDGRQRRTRHDPVQDRSPAGGHARSGRSKGIRPALQAEHTHRGAPDRAIHSQDSFGRGQQDVRPRSPHAPPAPVQRQQHRRVLLRQYQAGGARVGAPQGAHRQAGAERFADGRISVGGHARREGAAIRPTDLRYRQRRIQRADPA